MLFQDAIDYSKVKVHGEPYLWFGLQPKNVAMTPDGEMVFPESEYRSDFFKNPKNLPANNIDHELMFDIP